MNKSRLLGTVTAILTTLVTASANAAFIGRLETSPGSGVFQAYYDDQLDITWTADANINGLAGREDQVIWAAGLMIDGVGGWRLPSMDVNGDGGVVDCRFVTHAACLDNEYGHLFHFGSGTTFGNGITPDNPGPFSNIVDFIYGSGTISSTDSSKAWFFDFNHQEPFATQGTSNRTSIKFAWAVHSGDVSAVPVPAAVWLFCSGLIGLVGIAGRKKA